VVVLASPSIWNLAVWMNTLPLSLSLLESMRPHTVMRDRYVYVVPG
jgi:hypothetical protein